MTQRHARTPARSANAPRLRALADGLAADLAGATQASGCLILRSGASHPVLLSASTAAHAALAQHPDAATLLARAAATRQPAEANINALYALAVPLPTRPRPLLALLFAEHPLDARAASAACALATRALNAAPPPASEPDLTDDRVHLREIQVSRNLIRGAIDSIPIGLALLDAEGTLLAANRPLAAHFGCEPADLVSSTYDSALGEWDNAPARQVFATGQPGRARRPLTLADGRERLMEISALPLRDTDGAPYQVVELWEDITERVSLQTQLVRAERLAAIGQLAASIAHEVGNPLQAIQGFLSLFLEQCPPDTANRRFLELADGEIDRIVQVLSRLRDLYRPRADIIAAVSLNDLAEHVLLLTNRQLEQRRVRAFRELDAALPRVDAVADQLKQVLLNLVLNAAEAMPNGGLLHIQTRSLQTGGVVSGAQITITDTGVGIAPDQIGRIFDGLHTSKERGMGLGLYTSKAIIDRHMGTITVQSARGEGTTFTITLPLRTEDEHV